MVIGFFAGPIDRSVFSLWHTAPTRIVRQSVLRLDELPHVGMPLGSALGELIVANSLLLASAAVVLASLSAAITAY
jgi:hypothetical protein